MSEVKDSRAAAALLARNLLLDETPIIARRLAEAVARLEVEAIRLGVLDAIARLESQAARDEVWAVWAETRASQLQAFLVRLGWVAVNPPNLAVLSALLLDQTTHLGEAGSAIISPLLVACSDLDPVIARRAGETLQRLRNPEAQEELCRWVIERDHPAAHQAALAAGFAPQQPHHRALFYLLTEQWQQYEQLDFDASLLKAVYETGSPPLRARIAGLARRAGWSGYVQAVADHRQTRRLEELSAIEWEVIRTLLAREQRWDMLWQLAQSAPPKWSARLLRSLGETDWQPEAQWDRDGFSRLVGLAEQVLRHGEPVEQRPRLQAVLRGHSRMVTTLAFSPLDDLSGPLLATGSADRTVRLWRLPAGEVLSSLEGHQHYILNLHFSPDGSWLATSSTDKTARLWRLPGGEAWKILGGHAGEVKALAISPNGQFLATGDAVTARLWSLPDARMVRLLPEHPAALQALAFTPDGELLVSGTEDKSLHLWRVSTGEPVSTLMESVSAWEIVQDGSSLVTTSPYGRVRLWSLPEGNLRDTLDVRTDGSLIASRAGYLASVDRQDIYFRKFDSDSQTRKLEAHPRPVSALGFNPDGSLLASGSEDQTARLWQMPEGRFLRTLEGHSGPVRRLAFSPDGNLLATAGDENVRLWALEDFGRVISTSAAEIEPPLLAWGRQLLDETGGTEFERDWIEFAEALMLWRRRFDIAIESAPQRLNLGEFDIEIVG